MQRRAFSSSLLQGRSSHLSLRSTPRAPRARLVDNANAAARNGRAAGALHQPRRLFWQQMLQQVVNQGLRRALPLLGPALVFIATRLGPIIAITALLFWLAYVWETVPAAMRTLWLARTGAVAVVAAAWYFYWESVFDAVHAFAIECVTTSSDCWSAVAADDVLVADDGNRGGGVRDDDGEKHALAPRESNLVWSPATSSLRMQFRVPCVLKKNNPVRPGKPTPGVLVGDVAALPLLWGQHTVDTILFTPSFASEGDLFVRKADTADRLRKETIEVYNRASAPVKL
jgi:hypothetical protein